MNAAISHSDSPDRDFPESFLWGASSCPACCEGETVSDWGLYSAPDGSVPDDGPRHWRRYRYDFKALSDLGFSAYRFGCDWARLQREPYSRFNREETFRYLEMLAELRGRRIEPWLVLFYQALPRWAVKSGGWLNPEMPALFADYVHRLADVTDGEVMNWVTMHEPQMYAMRRFAWGSFPGGIWGRPDLVRKAVANMRRGHHLAARAIRRRLPPAKVGLALPGGGFFPSRAWHPGDWLAARAADWVLNGMGLSRFMADDGRCDFLMLGTGNEAKVRAGETFSVTSGVSALLPGKMREPFWPVSVALRRARLQYWLARHSLPVYLTGTALPDNGGDFHGLLAPYTGLDGTGAAGFFYEPLMDQFDLDRGLLGQGGLLRVDFHSPERRRDTRSFAKKLSNVIRSGRLPPSGQL